MVKSVFLLGAGGGEYLVARSDRGYPKDLVERIAQRQSKTPGFTEDSLYYLLKFLLVHSFELGDGVSALIEKLRESPMDLVLVIRDESGNELERLALMSCDKSLLKTLLYNGTVVNCDEKFQGSVWIEGGVITRVERGKISPDVDALLRDDGFDRVVNCEGRLIMPGGIDSHVHAELPITDTLSSQDGYESLSKMGLIGGTTLYFDFVTPKKGGKLMDAYNEWYERSLHKSYSAYAFHMSVVEFNQDIREQLAEVVREKKVNTLKIYLAYKGILQLDTDIEVLETFKACRELGLLPLVHAEHGDLVIEGQKKIVERGIRGPAGHPLSRPVYVEFEATSRALAIANMAESPVYIVHISNGRTANLIREAKRRGQVCFGESLSSHLTLTGDGYFGEDTQKAACMVMSPPLRDKADQVGLQECLIDGTIDTIGTDHCTFTIDQKLEYLKNGKDFRSIPNGTGGVEDRMSVIWDEFVVPGKLSMEDFVLKTSAQAARLFNIYPSRGRIAEGSIADIVVWDPKVVRTISAETHHSNIKFNLYEGRVVHGGPVMTFSGGDLVVEATFKDNGEIDWKNPIFRAFPGEGKLVTREPFASFYDRLL